MVSPSKVIFQSVGVNGVTTSSPQPQQQLWADVAYSIDTYSTPAQGARGCGRRNDARVACAVSREIPIDQHVAVGGVSAVMLMFEVSVEAADFLPLHDCQDSIQGIEIRNLNVGCINGLHAATDE